MKYTKTDSKVTKPSEDYGQTISNLKSDTEYDIVLLVNYQYFTGYKIPSANEQRFIVKTNQSQPGIVTITSVQCSKKRQVCYT